MQLVARQDLRSEENRAGRHPGRLDSSDGEDAVPDETVPIVDPVGKAEACLVHAVRVDGRLAGSPGQRPKEGVDGRDGGHWDASGEGGFIEATDVPGPKRRFGSIAPARPESGA